MRELDRLLSELREAGFEYIISHPDRFWRLHVWTKKRLSSPPFEVSIVAMNRRELIETIKAILLGYQVGKEG